MYRLFSLRLVLPVLIGMFMLLAIAVSLYVSRHLIVNEINQQETTTLNDRLNFLQGVVEHFIRFNEDESIKQLVSSLSSEADFIYLAVIADNGSVVASSEVSDQGKHWSSLKHQPDAVIVSRILTSQNIASHYDEASSVLTGYGSLCVKHDARLIRSNECGFIYYQLDLDYHYRLAEVSIYKGYLFAGSILAVGVLILLWLIHRLITRRVSMLVDVLSLYGEGDYQIRPTVSGHDELSWLSQSIASLLDTIEKNQRKILEREQRLENLFQTVIDAIVVIDNNGFIRRINKAAEKLFGYSENELAGRNVSVLMPEPYKSGHDQYLKNYKDTGIKKIIGVKREVTACKRNGETFPVEISVTEMQVGRHIMYSGIIRDITERKEFENAMQQINDELIATNQKLNEYATKDSLTNLYNRRSFDIRLAEEINRATRDKLPLSLLMCDIDYFKLFNDTYGHQHGDECLYKVATIIKTFFQRGGEMVARYGGEEFMVILPNTDSDRAKWLADMLLMAIHELRLPHSASGVADTVTISVGIGCYLPSDNVSPTSKQLIHSADEGLYKAKANGRDRVELGAAIS